MYLRRSLALDDYRDSGDGMSFPKPKRRVHTSAYMGAKLVANAGKGNIVDRTQKRSDGKTGKRVKGPEALLKFFRPIGE